MIEPNSMYGPTIVTTAATIGTHTLQSETTHVVVKSRGTNAVGTIAIVSLGTAAVAGTALGSTELNSGESSPVLYVSSLQSTHAVTYITKTGGTAAVLEIHEYTKV
jgi:hypothetical protein